MIRQRTPAGSFHDLEVWRAAHTFVLDVYPMTAAFPKQELFGLTSQLRRAAVSVPANIAEGFSRRGRADKARFFNIAEASLAECRYYLTLARDLGYAETAELDRAAARVSYKLQAYTAAIRRNTPPSS